MQSRRTFLSTVDKIKESLKQDLPGKDFQLKMLPLNRKIRVARENLTDAAVLILLFPKNDKTFTIFIERTLDKSIHSGQVSLPGGKYENQDQNLIETAIREAEEEIGVKRDDVRIIGQLTELRIEVSGYNVLPIIGYVNYSPTFVPSPDEVNSIIECDLNSLFADSNKSIKEISIGGYKIKTPSYMASNHIIWGATAMILREFEEIISRLQQQDK